MKVEAIIDLDPVAAMTAGTDGDQPGVACPSKTLGFEREVAPVGEPLFCIRRTA
jgi:hypothetical protein